MPPCPAHLQLDPCEVREWSLEIIVSSYPEAEYINVGVRFNHEGSVWCPVRCSSLSEAEAAFSNYEGMSLEEIMEEIKRTSFVRDIPVPEDASLPSHSHVARRRAFTHEETRPAHWSIVLTGYDRWPECIDIGLRLNHAAYTSLLSINEPARSCLPLLVGIVTGEISLRSLLSHPTRAYGGGRAGPHELEAMPTASLEAQAAAIRAALFPLLWGSGEQEDLAALMDSLLLTSRKNVRED